MDSGDEKTGSECMQIVNRSYLTTKLHTLQMASRSKKALIMLMHYSAKIT